MVFESILGTKAEPGPLITRLPEIKLHAVGEAAKFDASDLLKEGKPVLFLVIRRPRCVLCREQAGELAKFKATIERCGVRMVGVLKEELGADEFKAFWPAPLFVDDDKEFYKLVGRGSLHSASTVDYIAPQTLSNLARAKAKGYSGLTGGEGFIYGGLLIVKPDGEISYQYAEKHWGDHAPVPEVIEACKALAPEDVRAAINKEGVDFSQLSNGAYCGDTACRM
ncbi:hypothetical protein HK105_201699 [Polyrhizophydium stewartii]|uniref:Peroxiredoxin-like 2A n=1 Tax=Polyrhizophydium stewartii TaxID=2732419 RepID=A0ABR4NH57_9FUNG